MYLALPSGLKRAAWPRIGDPGGYEAVTPFAGQSANPAPDPPSFLAWFVARTKPNREDHAERSLSLRGLAVFLPRIVEVGCYVSLFPRQQPAPLFPGYLFVHLNLPVDYQRVIWAPGVRELLCLGGGPIPIGDDVIDQLRLRCDPAGVVHVASTPWNRGDRVEIAAGPFAGLLATVETVMPRRQRIKLLIDFLARQTSVDLPLTAIKGVRPRPAAFAGRGHRAALPGRIGTVISRARLDNAVRVAPG
jgi:transcriptional antiterminator RfaH